MGDEEGPLMVVLKNEAYRVKIIRMLEYRGLSLHNAEEIYQRLSVRALDSCQKFDSSRSSKAYLNRIAYTLMVGEFKKSSREFPNESALSNGTQLFNLIEGKYETPLEVLMREEMERAVMSVLSRLPEKYSSVLEGCYFENMSYRRMGRRAGISFSTVSKHLTAARRMFRGIVEGSSGAELELNA